jgi:polyphosphate kinase
VVFISSADWLPRNFFRRIEVAYPVDDGVLRERIIHELLGVTLADNVKARFMQPDGSYVLRTPDDQTKCRRSQFDFIGRVRSDASVPAKARQAKATYPRVTLMPSPFKGRK